MAAHLLQLPSSAKSTRLTVSKRIRNITATSTTNSCSTIYYLNTKGGKGRLRRKLNMYTFRTDFFNNFKLFSVEWLNLLLDQRFLHIAFLSNVRCSVLPGKASRLHPRNLSSCRFFFFFENQFLQVLWAAVISLFLCLEKKKKTI